MKVFYCDKMNAKPRKRSPSPGTPKLVAENWKDLPVEFVEPEVGASLILIGKAHDRHYIEGIFDGSIPDGFYSTEMDIRNSLVWTTGAMVSAACEAFRSRKHTAALCSGFHHAHYDHAEGFCTFNGLIAAAFAIRLAKSNARVGIIDCDYHYGNGTDDIIKRLGLDWIKHFTAGAKYFMDDHADDFLATLPSIVESMSDCDVILYQAGADQYIKDPLGGMLTIEQLKLRDEIVFASRVPIAFNLAGGYKRAKDGTIPEVLEIHRNTALACLRSEV